MFGAIRAKYDIRDYWFKPRALGASPFDWDKGYDLEEDLGIKFVVKDQNGSLSCGGQAGSYYMEALEFDATKTYEPRSARDIYSRIYSHGGGGVDDVSLFKYMKSSGVALEKDAPSYENGEPPSETFMRQIPRLTTEAEENKEMTKVASFLKVEPDIDHVAQAILQHRGCIIGVGGKDNGTWRTQFPQPPVPAQVWGHWLFCVGAKKMGGKKFIKVINSWGKETGDNGYQWLGEDYFTTGHVWYGRCLSWDFNPPLIKKLMIQVIGLLKALIRKL